MRLNTTTLFYKLIKMIGPDSVYDVGSLDGAESLKFRKILPAARIVAFEPNPSLAEAMKNDKRLKNKRVEIQMKAVWSKNGLASFYQEQVSADDKDDWRRGISSLYRRPGGSLGIAKIKVPAVRLDNFARDQDSRAGSIALWVDVEGAAFDVLDGIRDVYDRICLVHVEVETKKLWIDQKLEFQVEKLMRRMGFVKIAEGFNNPQHDIVFVNGGYFKYNKAGIILAIFYVLILSYLEILINIVSLNHKRSLITSDTP